MANALYTKCKQKLLEGSIDLISDNIKVCLVDSADYTLSIATHDFLDDIPGAAIVATSGNLASKTVTDGVFDADDITFSSVTGDQFEYIIVYKDSGTASTSPLIACFDTATNMPATPVGTNITVQWSSGSSKIFRLT